MVNKKDFDELKDLLNARFDEQGKDIKELNKKYEELIEENKKLRQEQQKRIVNLERELSDEKEKSIVTETKLKTAEKCIEDLKTQLEDTNKELLSIDSYHRRENLRFHGLKNKGTPEETVRSFLISDLKISAERVEKIAFQRIHRVGKPLNENSDTRPILARFLSHEDITVIKDAARKKGKGIPGGVQEDLPVKWAQARKALQDKFVKPARLAGIPVKIRWFQDCLQMNDKNVDPTWSWDKVKQMISADN